MSPLRFHHRHPRARVHARAFSLIELLITMAIIIILYTMMFGFGAKQNQLRQKAKCRSNLQKMYVSLQIYANDSRGMFPVVTNATTSETALDVLVPRYSADNSIFICPGSKDKRLTPGEPLANARISYAYYMGRTEKDRVAALLSDRQLNTAAKAVGELAFSDNGKKPANNHHKYGGSFLFTDGTMDSSPPALTIPLPLATNITLLNPKP
jgi:prepilin-type N-terminal cleavage/methylation domain-containing protein